MERLPVQGAGRPATAVPDTEAAARLAAALGQAGAEPSVERDREVVRELRSATRPDPLLERLDIEMLAGLVDRWASHLAAGDPDGPLRREAWDLLALIRRPLVLRRIEPQDREAWASRLLVLVERSHLTVGPLFRHRAEGYGSKKLFEIPTAGASRTLSWRQAAARVELIARGLLALDDDGEPGRVAILSENRIEMALTDLACLGSGLVNIVIPANSTTADVQYMLGHARARTVVVSSRTQLHKVLEGRENLPELRHVVCFDTLRPAVSGVLSLDSLVALSRRTPAARVRERSDAVRIDDLATVMYTSGTTGTPKGVQFSHRNIVFKRFARALALPEIGEDDVFLCYLPLFHTFGRFLEMLACVFWGSTYCFLQNPSVDALVRAMRRHRPTVLISVPKKWIQLYDEITREADPIEASDDELREATRHVTGGRLRWGLSAAGHLDSEIFRFFQLNGVELMSGFGMTEATGGITMTPPGQYADDSLGCALPGIELRIEDDGELLIRGPYVTMGFLDPPDGDSGFEDGGWLRTGDLMEVDRNGFLRLVDRKKEIYKNIKGETIAPQRVESLFRDFPVVRRAFLVGDHRPYNTVLLYPAPDYEDLDVRRLPPEELREHLRSIVVSVNKFLSPYERIVDFAVIDRDLDPERGELTPKGTPRRSVVERNFQDAIRLLYRRANLRFGKAELVFPNWLFQALGLTAGDIRVDRETLRIPSRGASLTVRRRGRERVQIGSCLYRHRPGPLNLGSLLSSPNLWLGNEELVAFVGLDLTSFQRPTRREGLEWCGRRSAYAMPAEEREALVAALDKPEPDLMDLHRAALALASRERDVALDGVRLLARVLAADEGSLAEPSRLLLARTTVGSPVEVRRRAFRTLVPAEPEGRFHDTLERFLGAPGIVLDRVTRAALVEETLSDAKVEAFVEAAHEIAAREGGARDADRRAVSLFRLLAAYGAAHPVSYRRLRAFLIRMMLFGRESIRGEAAKAAGSLTRGFRQWLGATSRIAVDPETGREYRWEDVVVFDDDVSESDRRRLLSALRTTSLLREAVFLFSRGTAVRLANIPPGGVWVRLLGARHGKAVYRVTVQTRLQGSYDVAVNVNHELTPEQVREETNWLILCGDARGRPALVEDFGGYWSEQDLWSEEFIAGETLERAMGRLSKSPDNLERFRTLWPFFCWTTLAAYVDFWNRTGRRWEVADAGMSNVVVPTHDYHTGARLVSVSNRRPHAGLMPMLRSMRDELVRPAEQQYPALAGLVGWNIVLSSVLEVVGVRRGLELLRRALKEEDRAGGPLQPELAKFIADVERRGFEPMRLYFAIRRYGRWERLSDEATPQARAQTLQEIYETYGLRKLARSYPEVRVRFFRETVFRDASPLLAEGLDDLIGRLRRRELNGDELIDAVADLRSRLELGPDDDYFLARLSFPYLRPEDAAGFVQADRGEQRSEMVVQLEDQDGNPFRVRHAMNPKEVGRLHRLFLAAKLDVRFRPEHQYLVAINERNHIIGGIYYELEEDGQSAHLEKIVVALPYRKKGVADGLMKEFFNRLSAGGIQRVTTGFFRPQYFYGYGFTIEKRYAGLVKSLEEE